MKIFLTTYIYVITDLLVIFPASARAQSTKYRITPEIEGLLTQLDSLLENSNAINAAKESRLDDLRTSFAKTDNTEKLYWLAANLYEEYSAYDSDSAMTYALKARSLAEKMHRPDLVTDMELNRAYIFSATGLLDEATRVLAAIDEAKLTEPQLWKYADRMLFVSSHRDQYVGDHGRNTAYPDEIDSLLQRVLPRISSSDRYYSWFTGWGHFKNKEEASGAIKDIKPIVDNSKFTTRADIDFIASTGANTIRLPFHYKLFTDEDYMGLPSGHNGYAHIDSVVTWCRDNGLYLILDMHDAPGGQTGDNIDDSYAFPWLMESPRAQKLFCDIWEQIAERYENEPVILGYELINEPIAHYFDAETLNAKLEPLHKRAVEAIRRHDNNHIILLGGPQWNSNFSNFTDWSYDDKIMYTCHRYGGEPTADAIHHFIAFRDSTGLPMYMGEIGHNTDEWQAAFCDVLEDNNIGYTFWPYKKLDSSCMNGITRPADWDSIVAFVEAPRDSYKAIREARPDTALARKALREFVENSRFENCTPQKSYIKSIKLNID